MFARIDRRTLSFVAAVSCAALAACGGSNNNTTTPTVQCTLPPQTSVTQVYPIPGATQVPDALGEVVLAVNPPLPSGWQILLLNPFGSYFGNGLQTGTPNPFPTPAAPVPAGATLQFDTFTNTGGLRANSLFQVALNNTNSTCNSYPTIGSFSSQ